MRNLLTYKDYFLAFYSGLPEKPEDPKEANRTCTET